MSKCGASRSVVIVCGFQFAFDTAQMIALVPPVHVKRSMTMGKCFECDAPVWSDGALVVCSACVVANVQAERDEPTAQKMRAMLSSAFWKYCDGILSGAPSQLPVPSWSDIVAHPHVLEQPHHQLGENDDTLLLHNACAALDPDAVRAVLKRWPESVNVKNEVLLVFFARSLIL